MKAMFRRAVAVALSASAMTIISGGLPLSAQESGKAKVDSRAKVESRAKAESRAKPAKRAFDPTRRVPNYFGQLGLTDAQREAIYKIQAEHQPRIEELEKQLEEVRADSLKECEAVLNEAQRKMLTERRSAAAGARSKRGGAAAEAKPRG